MLLMGLRGCLHANAGVWAAVVVEADEAGDPLPCVTDCLEAPLTVDDFRLEDAVHAFCNGVVRGLVVLRHGDADAVFPQFVRIGITAVLHAAV